MSNHEKARTSFEARAYEFFISVVIYLLATEELGELVVDVA
jgi:hypothetical protein